MVKSGVDDFPNWNPKQMHKAGRQKIRKLVLHYFKWISLIFLQINKANDPFLLNPTAIFKRWMLYFQVYLFQIIWTNPWIHE